MARRPVNAPYTITTRYSGQVHHIWKGELAGYRAKHRWLQKHFGKASICDFDITHTATRFHWSNISGNYLRDINDWQQLCPKCHKDFDRKQLPATCKRGHEYTEENTRTRTSGERVWRVCRQCSKIHNQSHRQRSLYA